MYSSVQYLVLVNGMPSDTILSTRSLRQGDPLSPYLFLLYAEGLSSIINYYDSTKLIQGLSMTKGGITINHLLFANECILFHRATVWEWRNL